MALEQVTLHAEDTGGNELNLLRKVLRVEHPYIPESKVKPDRVDMEALIWKNPEIKTGEKIQYVIMGGMNINAVEVHPILSMLTNHADTVIGLAHPDAPQSQITPPDSPFNDDRSFANSGFAALRSIESLIKEEILDPNSPIIVVGYSTGAAALIESVSQDIQEAENPLEPRNRYIQKAVLLSPGGMLDMGEKKIVQGVGNSGALYWKEFLEDEAIALWNLMKHPQKLIESLSSAMTADNPMENIAYAMHIAKRLKLNLSAMKNWPPQKEWKSISSGHKWFEVFENLVRLPRWEFLDRVHAQFHRMWIDQPGWPHISPETPAFRKSRENVAYDVTSQARHTIHNTPIVLWLGANDQVIHPDKFLKDEERLSLQKVTEPNEQEELKINLILNRAREAFQNNTENMHVVFAQGIHSHHLSPREDASILELDILRYLHPDLMKPQTLFDSQTPEA